MDAEDASLHVVDLAGQLVDVPVELVLLDVSRTVPRRLIGVADSDHLVVAVDPDDLSVVTH